MVRQTGAAEDAAAVGAHFASRWWGTLLLLLATVVLLSLAVAPFKQFYLAWIALIPWLAVVSHCRSARTAFIWSWIGGIGFFTANMWWLVYVTGPGLAALMLLLGMYWAGAAAIIRGAALLPPAHPGKPPARSMPAIASVFLIATIWVAMEWLRATWPLGGLAWQFLGHAQSPALPLCQIADTTGVYGVSFCVALVNAWVAMLILGGWNNRRRLLPAATAIAAVLAMSASYGLFRMSQRPTRAGPTVMVVQPVYPQSNSGEKSATSAEILDFHLRITASELARHPGVNLVVWSETMMPQINPEARQFALEHGGGFLERTNEQIVELARRYNVSVLVGGMYWADWYARAHDYMARDRRNSAYLYTPGGQSPRRYDKIHLVPFGEYLPFKSGFPPLYRLFLSLSPYSEEYTLTAGPADAMTVFTLEPGGWRFVAPICFEDMDGVLLARMFRAPQATPAGKRADFIVNLTNDGWFRFNEMAQHLQMAVFRSIENRAPTARSVNTGISGFIDSAGRTSGLIPVGQEGASVQTLVLDDRLTFYTRCGDVFAYFCVAVTVVLTLVTIARWWRARRRPSTAPAII